MSDHELLQRYVESRSQSAFAALVQRHVDLVYSAALRQVRARQLAEDVTQAVFVDLAQHATKLDPAQPLAAWLFVVTRRTAVDAIRCEARRQARENTAAEMEAVMKTPSPTWHQVKDSLDEAMETLGETDRSAILLRFFENRSLNEVGAALGISDDAAQKRVARALEQLRTFFATRGVRATSAGLAASLASHAVEIAPAALAASISASAVLGVATGHAAASGSSFFALGTGPKIAVGLAAAAVIGVATWQTAELLRHRAEGEALRTQVAQTENELGSLRDQRDRIAARLRSTEQESVRIRAAVPAVELDAEVEAWLARVAQLRELATLHPEQALPEFSLLTDKDWFDAARDAVFENEGQRREQLSKLRTLARWRAAPLLREAIRRFADANQARLPTDILQLAPFARGALTREILARYHLLAQGALPGVPPEDWLLEERTSFDEAQDNRLFIARWRAGIVPFSEVRAPHLRVAVQRYLAAHDGRFPPGPAHLLSYFPVPPSPVALKAWLEKPPADFKAEIRKLLPEG